jgi:hypothetical protein
MARNQHITGGERGIADISQQLKYNRLFYYGRVVQIADDGTKRLRVKIKGIDDDIVDDNDLEWAHAFLPFHVNIVPKVGETVKVLLMDTQNPYSEREWIGPLISEPRKLEEDPHYYSARNGRVGSLLSLGQSIFTIADTDQIFPQPDDVSLLGRNNSDVICRKDEVLIRAGKHVTNFPTLVNLKNPGYINVRLLRPSDIGKDEKTNSDAKALKLDDERVDTVILSNKIFLIGRDSNSNIIKLKEGNTLSKEQHINLEDSLHPIVYGDILLEFMEIFQTWMITHIHEGTELGVDVSGDTNRMLDWFQNRLPKLLSKNVFAGGDIEGSGGLVNDAFQSEIQGDNRIIRNAVADGDNELGGTTF